jgi:hypothetical protein
MTKRSAGFLALALAVSACGNKDDSSGGKKESGGGSGGKNDKPAKIDPTLSWKEQPGPGFVVLAPQGPTQSKGASKDPLVKQITIYGGYQAPGSPGDFKVTVTEFTDKIATADPLKIMRDAIKEPVNTKQVDKTEDTGSIVGEPPGMEAVYSGNDATLGAIKMRARVFFKSPMLYVIQGRYTAANKDFGYQTQTFVDSFKLK